MLLLLDSFGDPSHRTNPPIRPELTSLPKNVAGPVWALCKASMKALNMQIICVRKPFVGGKHFLTIGVKF